MVTLVAVAALASSALVVAAPGFAQPRRSPDTGRPEFVPPPASLVSSSVIGARVMDAAGKDLGEIEQLARTGAGPPPAGGESHDHSAGPRPPAAPGKAVLTVRRRARDSAVVITGANLCEPHPWWTTARGGWLEEKGGRSMTRKDDRQQGVPGEGKGRRDEVGRSGIWPASGPLPPGSDVPIVGQEELGHGPREPRAAEMPAGASAFETDPVCGSRINTASAERRDYKGHAYYFDSVTCQRRFDEAPERFATMPDRRRA